MFVLRKMIDILHLSNLHLVLVLIIQLYILVDNGIQERQANKEPNTA